MPSLATFNANNFFLRYKFTNLYPGDRSKNSLIDASKVIGHPIGYLPGLAFQKYTRNYIVWDQVRRRLAAKALREPDEKLPDILCLQEVENIHAIRLFNQQFLNEYYRYSLLIDSYDDRNIDVGILSTFPIREIKSHIDDKIDDKRIFSRDCLEAEIELPDGPPLWLFLNHLKSRLEIRKKGETKEQYDKRVKESHEKRQTQAEKIVAFLKERFKGKQSRTLYAVVGDFNDTPESPYLEPLLHSKLLVDVIGKHRPQDNWTYYWRSKNHVSQIDYVLASEALAARIENLASVDPKKRPHIERRGLGYKELDKAGKILPEEATFVHIEKDDVTPLPAKTTPSSKVNFRFPRYKEVMADWKNNISDHCPVKVWF